MPCRSSSELLKLAVTVCWQMGCMGTISRPPRLFGTGWCQMTVLPVGRPHSQQGATVAGASSSRFRSSYEPCFECLRAMRLSDFTRRSSAAQATPLHQGLVDPERESGAQAAKLGRHLRPGKPTGDTLPARSGKVSLVAKNQHIAGSGFTNQYGCACNVPCSSPTSSRRTSSPMPAS